MDKTKIGDLSNDMQNEISNVIEQILNVLHKHSYDIGINAICIMHSRLVAEVIASSTNDPEKIQKEAIEHFATNLKLNYNYMKNEKE